MYYNLEKLDWIKESTIIVAYRNRLGLEGNILIWKYFGALLFEIIGTHWEFLYIESFENVKVRFK